MERTAIREVVYENQKLYLLKTNKGDVKFIGGGVENGEAHFETLKREAMEEAGVVLKIDALLGTTY